MSGASASLRRPAIRSTANESGGWRTATIYLRKLACHLYYTFDDHEVIVRALWGARRERDPVP
jgi:hypothetical protein